MSSTSRSTREADPKNSDESGTGGFIFTRQDATALFGLFVATLAFFWPMIRPWGHWYIASGDFSDLNRSLQRLERFWTDQILYRL